MLVTVEGIYKQGHIVLSEQPPNIHEAKVVVIFLDSKAGGKPSRMLHYGKYAGAGITTEDDFKLAERHGDPEFDEPSS